MMKKLVVAMVVVLMCVVSICEAKTKTDREVLREVMTEFINDNLLKTYKKGEERDKYIKLIVEEALVIEDKDSGMGIFMLGLAKVESSFRLVGNKKSSAKGLCQVIPRWHTVTLKKANITEEDLLTSPRKSLRAGYLVFKGYLRGGEDFKAAIRRYRGARNKKVGIERADHYGEMILANFGEMSIQYIIKCRNLGIKPSKISVLRKKV